MPKGVTKSGVFRGDRQHARYRVRRLPGRAGGLCLHRKQWIFYRTSTGAELVRDELNGLGEAPKAALAAAMKRYARDELLPGEVKNMPGIKANGVQVYELRVNLGNNHYRLLFAQQGRYGQILLALSAVAKNQNRLPKRDRDRVVTRLKDYLDRGDG
jgi:phage-related protein